MMYQKNRIHQTLVRSQLGQATVELVLLISVSLILMLTFAFQIYQPFSSWLDSYMGQYLECLIDMGELPTVSGSGRGDLVCGSRFEAFTMVRGRPPILGSGSSGRSSGSQSGSNRNSSSSSGRGRNGNNTSSSSNSGSGSNNGQGSADSGGGSRSSTGSGRSQIVRSSTGGLSDVATDEESRRRRVGSKNDKKNGSGSESDRNFVVGGRSDGSISEDERLRRLRTIGVAGQIEEERERAERGQSRVVRSSSEAEGSSSQKRLVVKNKERKIAAEDQQEQGWNLGRIFRIAIIVLIIIGLILFIGGQAVSISKGMEK